MLKEKLVKVLITVAYFVLFSRLCEAMTSRFHSPLVSVLTLLFMLLAFVGSMALAKWTISACADIFEEDEKYR
jgi:hypothetical protein